MKATVPKSTLNDQTSNDKLSKLENEFRYGIDSVADPYLSNLQLDVKDDPCK